MKDFYRNDLKSIETPQEKDPCHHHFGGFVYFLLVWTSISDLPIQKFLSRIFLGKVWLKHTLPSYNLDRCPKYRSFILILSLVNPLKFEPLNKIF